MNKTRILVVDDEEVLRNLCQEVLSSEGYDVLCAASGEEGFKKVQSGRFDLVVTDYRMQGMDGIELLHRIKAFNATIQVILLTSHIGPKTALDAMKAGAFWYLTKPVDIDKLVEKVREALLEKRGSSSAGPSAGSGGIGAIDVTSVEGARAPADKEEAK